MTIIPNLKRFRVKLSLNSRDKQVAMPRKLCAHCQAATAVLKRPKTFEQARSALICMYAGMLHLWCRCLYSSLYVMAARCHRRMLRAQRCSQLLALQHGLDVMLIAALQGLFLCGA